MSSSISSLLLSLILPFSSYLFSRTGIIQTTLFLFDIIFLCVVSRSYSYLIAHSWGGRLQQQHTPLIPQVVEGNFFNLKKQTCLLLEVRVILYKRSDWNCSKPNPFWFTKSYWLVEIFLLTLNLEELILFG